MTDALADHRIAIPVEIGTSCVNDWSNIAEWDPSKEDMEFVALALQESYNAVHEKLDNGSGRLLDVLWSSRMAPSVVKKKSIRSPSSFAEAVEDAYVGYWVRAGPVWKSSLLSGPVGLTYSTLRLAGM